MASLGAPRTPLNLPRVQLGVSQGSVREATLARDESAAEECMMKHLKGFESILSEWFEQHMGKLL